MTKLKIFQKSIIEFLTKLQAAIFIFLLSGCSDGISNLSPTVSVAGPLEAVELSQVRLTSVAEDSDGSISSYLWTQKSGPSVTFSSVVNPSLDFIAPEVSNDEEITVELLVTDNDGGVASSGPVTITVKQSLADLNAIYDYQVTEEDTEVSVFISSLTINVNRDLLSEVSFKIVPMTSSIADPIKATFSIDSMTQTSEGFSLPIFGLFSDYINNVELMFVFTDGSSSILLKEVSTEVYDNPLSLKVIRSVDSMAKPSYSYLFLKSVAGIHILDIDGHFRWAANDPINAISSVYDNGAFKVFVGDEMHELKLSGKVISRVIGHDGLSNIDAHHDVEKGKTGYLVEIDADKVNRSDRVIESILLEIDSDGTTIKEWDFGTIFRKYLEGEGYDSSNFVRDGYDWFHMNSAIYDPLDDSIIASSRENFVVKVDYSSGNISWLLGDETKHWFVNYPALHKFSLTSLDLKPIGQHSLSLVEGDLMLFNNGQFSFQTPDGAPKGDVLSSSPASRYIINADLKQAEVVWSYDPGVYSDICSSIHRDASSPNGDYLVNYSVVDRLDVSEPKKPVRTILRGVNYNMETLFDFELPTFNCRTSWQSRPLSVLSDLRFGS